MRGAWSCSCDADTSVEDWISFWLALPLALAFGFPLRSPRNMGWVSQNAWVVLASGSASLVMVAFADMLILCCLSASMMPAILFLSSSDAGRSVMLDYLRSLAVTSGV